MSREDSRDEIRLDADLQAALEEKARIQGTSLSALVNDAVRAMLREDIEDLEAFASRSGQPTLSLDEMREALKEDGKP